MRVGGVMGGVYTTVIVDLYTTKRLSTARGGPGGSGGFVRRGLGLARR